MEIKIGVQSVPREVVVETDMTTEQLERALADALGTGDGVFKITSDRGGRILVPVDKLGYVEAGQPENRSVGFGTL